MVRLLPQYAGAKRRFYLDLPLCVYPAAGSTVEERRFSAR